MCIRDRSSTRRRTTARRAAAWAAVRPSFPAWPGARPAVRLPAASGVRGGGHRGHPWLMEQDRGAQPGVPGDLAAQHHDVRIPGLQPGERGVPAHQPHPGPGRRLELRGERGAGGGQQRGEPQPQGCGPGGRAQRGGQPGQERGEIGVEPAAGVGELDPAGRTVQQPGPQGALQRAHGPGQRGLADPQPVGGVGEAALLGDGDKAAQMPQFDAVEAVECAVVIHAAPA